MLGYLIRRILLFFPTLIGATLLVYGVLALAPIKVTDTLLPPGGDLQPGVREQREAYINERYGLGDPFPVRYFRWLNNASPVGLHVWRFDEPAVVEKRAERREWRRGAEARLREADPALAGDALREAVDAAEEEAEAAGAIDFTPKPGQFRFDKVPLKAPDLGDSYVRQRPAHELIFNALPVTLLLNFISLPLAVGISVLTGVWAANSRGRWQDWGTGGVLLGLSSLPQIWVGVLFIGYLCSEQYLRLFPAAGLHGLDAPAMSFLPSRAVGEGGEWTRGYLLDAAWHLTLPVICLTYAQFAYLSKIARTSLLEVLGSDYVRTAHAKGLAGNVVLWRHAFRNALLPIITVLAALLPAIIAGSVVVETIFSIDGMGRLLIESLKRGDNEVFLSLTLITLLLTMTAYLAQDIAYALADPRVSYE